MKVLDEKSEVQKTLFLIKSQTKRDKYFCELSLLLLYELNMAFIDDAFREAEIELLKYEKITMN